MEKGEGFSAVRETEHTPHLVSRLRIGGTLSPLHLTPSKAWRLRKHRDNIMTLYLNFKQTSFLYINPRDLEILELILVKVH